MGALKLAAAALLLSMTAEAKGRGIEHWQPYIAEASNRFGIPEEWIRRVMMAESGGRAVQDGLPIISRAGARGLMQLMPGTFKEMRRRHRLGADPDDPRDNILAGAAYLRSMYERFGYPGLFGAYNAGPRRFDRYLAGKAGLPLETISYIVALAGRGRAAPGRGSAGIFGTTLKTDHAGLFALEDAASVRGAPKDWEGRQSMLFAIAPRRPQDQPAQARLEDQERAPVAGAQR